MHFQLHHVPFCLTTVHSCKPFSSPNMVFSTSRLCTCYSVSTPLHHPTYPLHFVFSLTFSGKPSLTLLTTCHILSLCSVLFFYSAFHYNILAYNQLYVIIYIMFNFFSAGLRTVLVPDTLPILNNHLFKK